MHLPNETIQKIVKASGFVDKKKLDEVAKSANELNKPLTEVLIFKGLLSEDALGQLAADYFKVPYISLKKRKISKEFIEF